MQKSLLVLLLAMLSVQAKAEDQREMQSFDVNGLILTSAEYWPYHGTTDINYPDDVLWGFYPEAGIPEPGDTEPNPATASPEAVACATTAFRALQAFVQTEQPVLKEIIELGRDQLYTNKFYLWTNDYSDAAVELPYPMRQNRLWYWKRNPQVPGRTPGYWKWESVLTQDGRCLVPEDAQIRAYLQQTLADLQRDH
jgi:hypothetical protein